jgi:hypothetical protein
LWTGLLCHRGNSNLLDEKPLIVVFFLRQRKNLTKLVDRKIVSVRQSIGMGEYQEEIIEDQSLSYRLKVDCRERREIITELDNKATLQTSIKWDSAD